MEYGIFLYGYDGQPNRDGYGLFLAGFQSQVDAWHEIYTDLIPMGEPRGPADDDFRVWPVEDLSH